MSCAFWKLLLSLCDAAAVLYGYVKVLYCAPDDANFRTRERERERECIEIYMQMRMLFFFLYLQVVLCNEVFRELIISYNTYLSIEIIVSFFPAIEWDVVIGRILDPYISARNRFTTSLSKYFLPVIHVQPYGNINFT